MPSDRGPQCIHPNVATSPSGLVPGGHDALIPERKRRDRGTIARVGERGRSQSGTMRPVAGTEHDYTARRAIPLDRDVSVAIATGGASAERPSTHRPGRAVVGSLVVLPLPAFSAWAALAAVPDLHGYRAAAVTLSGALLALLTLFMLPGVSRKQRNATGRLAMAVLGMTSLVCASQTFAAMSSVIGTRVIGLLLASVVLILFALAFFAAAARPSSNARQGG